LLNASFIFSISDFLGSSSPSPSPLSSSSSSIPISKGILGSYSLSSVSLSINALFATVLDAFLMETTWKKKNFLNRNMNKNKKSHIEFKIVIFTALILNDVLA